jgi:hypothetical protein
MAYHVVVFTRQQVAVGALRFQDGLSNALMQRMVELAPRIEVLRAAGNLGQVNIPHDLVEIYSLNPFPVEEHREVRQRYGGDAFVVLFLNDAAREACEMFGIPMQYAAEIEEDQLPANVGVFISLENYGD